MAKPRRVRRLLSVLVSVALVVGLTEAVTGAGVASAAPVAAPRADQGSEPVTSRPDVVSARLAAAAQGSRVEVTSLEDAFSTTYANPDGSLTTDTSLAQLRVLRDGGWVPVDYTLQHVAGGWSPKVAPVPVTFSDGADTDAAAIGSGGKLVDLSWDVRLPAPTVDGPTATYDLGGGESLVLTATERGFEQSLVLQHAPVSLPQVRLPLDTADLTLASDGSGGYSFAKSDGTVVYTMPAPVMYGAQIDPETEEPTQSKVVSSALVQTASGPRLDLSPSLSWLQDPATTYPVTIDPTISAVSGSSDSFVQDNLTTSQVSTYFLRAGEHLGTNAARAYMLFNGVTALSGKHVTAATLNLYNFNANTCTPATMHVYPLTSDFTGSTVWSTKPSYTTSSSWAGSASFANGVGSCPNAWVHIDVQKLVSGWASGALAYHGLQMSGTETSGSQGWVFCSLNLATDPSYACYNPAHRPTLSVTYNTVPGAPASLSSAPCISHCTGGAYGNSATPKLSAKAGDADGGTLRYDFQVYNNNTATGTAAATGSVSNVAAGAAASWVVPAGKLVSRTWYYFRVRAYDGIDYGPYSAWFQFLVDTTAPPAPTVSSTTWSNGGWSSATSGTFTVPALSGDVAGYVWSLDGGAWSALSSATSRSFTGLASDKLHTVQVRAEDTAGNLSTASTLTFGIGTGGLSSPQEGDATQAQALLSADGASPFVFYQARQGSTQDFATIASSDVLNAPAAWPTVSTSASYVWNVDATAARLQWSDGDVEVRACFSASSSGANAVCQADSVHIALTTHSFDDSNATQDVGPGTLSLLTGDYSISATDANISAYNSSLSVSRTATTLAPTGATSDATGVFGPGWTASLDGPGGDAGLTPSVAPDKSSIMFTDSDGGQTIYRASSSLTADTITYVRNDTDPGDAPADQITVAYAWHNPADPPVAHITMTEADGTATTWTQPAGSSTWVPYSVIATGPAAANTTSYYYNADGLPTQIVAPSPVDCSTQDKANTTEGCRSLTFDYTTVTVGGADLTRLAGIKLVAWDPASSAMATTGIAAFDYDSSGRLAHAWDPRITPALKTAYTYDGDGRIATLTPPGLAAWTLHYDTGHRLSAITRPDPSGAAATTTMTYDVPLSGSGLPDLTPATAATWGETTDLPTTATAIFAPDHVPAGAPTAGDWPYAAISYLDVDGRQVNTAAYGAGAWQVDTTRYDATGTDVWDLSAGNRAQALNPTADTDPHVAAMPDSADRADLLADASIYNTGSDTVPAGSELLDELGPMHPVTLADGTVIDARSHTHTAYDQGAPNGDVNPDSGMAYTLPTSTTTSAEDTNGVDHDSQTSSTGYDSIDPAKYADGWATGQATSQTDPGGLITKTGYDANGLLRERRLPGDSAGTTPRTTLTSYYTATGTGDCVNPAFAGLLCSTAPAAQPATGNPLPVTTYSYDRYDQPTSKTETYGTGSGAVTRTWTTGYDPAGRASSTSVNVSPASAGGTALPAVTYAYDDTTGLPTTKSTGSGSTLVSLTTGYDSLGQATSYTDATGNTSTRTYDLDGRVTSLFDGKGTTTYTYDSSTEHRGLITSEDIGVTSAPSTFTATYDAAGDMTVETYPNGLTAARASDNAGNTTDLTYAKAGSTWLDFTQAFNAAGEVATQAGPISSQVYTYDGSDRLTKVQDTVTDDVDGTNACTTRVYTFDDHSNRRQLDSHPDAGTDPTNGACSTSTTAATIRTTYDGADRDINTGYSYDALGRTLAVPAIDAQGISKYATTTGALTVGYYANDLVASQHQGTATLSFALDPSQDRIASSSDGTTTTTNHYSDDSDSPAWTATSASAWSRNVLGIDGGQAATQAADGTITLQLANPHGDIVGTVDDSATATIGSYEESSEYGQPRDQVNAYQTYGWAGSEQRSEDALGGLILMGVRLYAPGTGRFITRDPIVGGSANAYAYTIQDPINTEDPQGTWWIEKHFAVTIGKGTLNKGSRLKHALDKLLDDVKRFIGWLPLGSAMHTVANFLLHVLHAVANSISNINTFATGITIYIGFKFGTHHWYLPPKVYWYLDWEINWYGIE